MGFDVVIDISAKGGKCTVRKSDRCLPERYRQTTLPASTSATLQSSLASSVEPSAAFEKYAEAPSIKAVHRLHKLDKERQGAHDYLQKVCFGHPTKPRSARRRVLREIPHCQAPPLELTRTGETPESDEDGPVAEWSRAVMYEDATLQKLCKIVSLAEALREAKSNRVAQSESHENDDFVVFSPPPPTTLEICSFLHKEVSDILQAELALCRLYI